MGVRASTDRQGGVRVRGAAEPGGNVLHELAVAAAVHGARAAVRRPQLQPVFRGQGGKGKGHRSCSARGEPSVPAPGMIPVGI